MGDVAQPYYESVIHRTGGPAVGATDVHGDPPWVDRVVAGPTYEQQRFLLDRLRRRPSTAQDVPLRSRARVKLVGGGERGGKSDYSAMELVTRAPWGRLFWIIAEDYEGTHKEFEYALQWFTQLDAVDKRDISMPLRHQWHMRLKTGQVIETKTGSDISKIRSDAPDGILLVEAATVPYGLFLKCFGRLGETRGWLVASGTFEGSSGWGPELFRGLQGATAKG